MIGSNVFICFQVCKFSLADKLNHIENFPVAEIYWIHNLNGCIFLSFICIQLNLLIIKHTQDIVP